MREPLPPYVSPMPSGLWGKSSGDGVDWHPVEYHCLDVGACAEALLDKNPYFLSWFARFFQTDDMQGIQRLLVLLAVLHDAGKFSRTFQNLDPALCDNLGIERLANGMRSYSRSKGTAHDSLGIHLWQEWICDGLVSEQLGIIDTNAQDFIGSAVFGHHGSPVNADQARLEYKAFPKTNIKMAREFFVNMVDLIGQGLPFPVLRDDVSFNSLSFVLSGFISVADWLGSGFPFLAPTMSMTEYLSHARGLAAVAVVQAGLVSAPVAKAASFGSLFPGLAATPLQEAVENIALTPQFLMFMEDSPGSGKTEAALIAVARAMSEQGARGMFFGLPTTATADAQEQRQRSMYRRLFDQDAKPSLSLAHGAVRRSDREDGNASCAVWIDEGRKRMLADICVGTVDQALLAALPAKFATVRLFGLLGKVLVIDEVHSFDSYTTKLICALLSMHAALGGSALLLSATLTAVDKRAMSDAFTSASGFTKSSRVHIEVPDYPLITIVDHDGSRIVAPARARRAPPDKKVILVSSLAEVESALLTVARNGGCALWVRNTVKAAIEGFSSLKSVHNDVTTFHAGFVSADRSQIQEGVLRRFGKDGQSNLRAGGVVVATSVIEQSLDLDFDLVVVDLKPMDALLQALGRARRHARRRDGSLLPDGSPDERDEQNMLVFSPDPQICSDKDWYADLLGTAKHVHADHAVLWRTAMAINREGEVRYSDIRRLVEEVYDEDVEVPECLMTSAFDAEAKQLSSASMARMLSNGFSPKTGYMNVAASWDDKKVPTREGESCRLVLVFQDAKGNLIPLKGDFHDGTIQVRANRLCGPIPKSEILGLRGHIPIIVVRYGDDFIHDGSVVKPFLYCSTTGIDWTDG